MMSNNKGFLIKGFLITKKPVFYILLIGLAMTLCFSDDESSAPARLANGVLIEGEVQEATDQGLMIKTAKGIVPYPWKYLSSGTRFRYERGRSPSPSAGKTNTVAQSASKAGEKK